MSYNNTPNSPTNDTAEFQADLDAAITSAKRKNVTSFILSLVIVGGLGYWLFGAYKQITSFDAATAVQFASGELQAALPEAGRTIEQQLIAAGPTVATQLENRLMKLPDQFADDLVKYTDEELARITPQVEEDLYQALKSALAHAQLNSQLNLPPGTTDEQKFTALIDVLADVYAARSAALVTEVRTKYATSSADLYTYLDFIATGQQLDRRQQFHRDMIETFLALAATYKQRADASAPSVSVN